MANPVLNEKTLDLLFEEAQDRNNPMSLEGTINKTGILLIMVTLGALLGWKLNAGFILALASMIATWVLSIMIYRTPSKSSQLAPVHAFCEGFFVGTTSVIYSFKYPGIVTNTLILTFSILLVMLGLYRFQIIVVGEKLRSGIIAATMALGMTYLINLVLTIVGKGIPMIHSNSPAAIAFSLIIVGLASFNLLLDFQTIEDLHDSKAPQYMEWYCGFSLIVNIVWLYIEILRLLSKFRKK